MILVLRGFSAVYEMESLARMLFPGTARSDTLPEAGDWILAEMTPQADGIRLSAAICLNGTIIRREEVCSVSLTEKQRTFPLCRLLYEAACEATGESLRWGLLTGIRPIKLYHRLAEQGMSESEIALQMQKKYLLNDEMNALALSIRREEAAVNEKSLPLGFSLYLSIPFCPQRCSYCSFVSSSVERMRSLIPAYVDALCREIAVTGEIARSLGLQLQTVYFGGGTPTTLDAPQLTKLFERIHASFDCSELLEFTVEAGRPDTIDRDRLLALKNAGVGRISINPQTMNDRVLAAVGRRHTAAEIEQAFSLAREIGFDTINMDLIAGLADETPEEFLSSLERVLFLRPENVTVHTLTLKRASTLTEEGSAQEYYKKRAEVTRMVDGARARLTDEGYVPYYLYRQKNTIGALDNTGYTLPGHAGCYNVFIMDETHTILACGAGAVTKLRQPMGEKIERIYNLKYPGEYLDRFDEIIERKEGVRKFYENYLERQKLPH